MGANGRVAVAQIGARMHYAVARILHAAGRLECLYTDFCASSGWPAVLRAALPSAVRPAPLARMLSRLPAGVPPERIRAFQALGISYALRRRLEPRTAEVNPTDLGTARAFARLVQRAGFGDADTLYSFNLAALELMHHARERGLRTVLEQTSPPLSMEATIVTQEAEMFPNWEVFDHEPSWLSAVTEREQREWEAADLILCPSPFVREALADCRAPVERCVVVPYGVAPHPPPPDRLGREGPLRVLTAGIVGLRKGSPYVLAAARALGRRAQFRMVGPAPLQEEALASLRAHLDLFGAVPRPAMAAHYAWADVFLLPSLCEGSATACYEAMAAGLPIVATPNSGSVVRDGVDGFIVPIRDVEALVARLALLASDRERLDQMAERARQRAAEYTLERYGERLLAALDGGDSGAEA